MAQESDMEESSLQKNETMLAPILIVELNIMLFLTLGTQMSLASQEKPPWASLPNTFP